jgi:uroporphyrin-III C-methyltransferase
MAGGRKPDEPTAIICHATLPKQTVLETTLSRCAADAAAAGLEPPAMVVIGEVVRLRAALDWLGASQGRALSADPLGTRRQTESA